VESFSCRRGAEDAEFFYHRFTQITQIYFLCVLCASAAKSHYFPSIDNLIFVITFLVYSGKSPSIIQL
jgi:hypothetical protein